MAAFRRQTAARMLLRELVDMLIPDRLPRLANATRTTRLLDAEQNARRARLANLGRFHEDIAWRFGHASVEPSSHAAPPRETRRQKPYVTAGAKSGQQRPRGDVDTTLRTAS